MHPLQKQSIEKFMGLLGNEFSLLNHYVNCRTPLRVKCLKHNIVFKTLASTAIRYSRITGCKECIKDRIPKDRYLKIKEQTKERFLALCKDNFLLKTDYVRSDQSLELECLKHNNVFNVKPRDCLRSSKQRIFGCKLCETENKSKPHKNDRRKINNFTMFKQLAKERNFTIIEKYINRKIPIKLYCNKHKQFFHISPGNAIVHSGIAGCLLCQKISLPERQIRKYVEKLVGKNRVKHGVIVRDKAGKILRPDVIVDSSIIIECNGIYWHSAITGSQHDNKWRHYNRRKRLESLGYRVIQIWEDSWIQRKPAIKRYLRAQLCSDRLPTWYARKLEVRLIKQTFANKFMNKYHPQGQAYGKQFCLGLFDSGLKRTIAIMTFSETSRPVLNKPNTAELVRYASKGRVNGGASRLLAHYLRQNKHIKEVISFSDNDYFNGNMYEAIGFKYDGEVKPDYMTIWSGQRRHKSYTKRTNLERMAKYKRIIFYPNWSEADCLFFNNIRRCWNSGKKRWIFHYQYVSNRQK